MPTDRTPVPPGSGGRVTFYLPVNCGTCGRFVNREDSNYLYLAEYHTWELGYPQCGPGRGCRKSEVPRG